METIFNQAEEEPQVSSQGSEQADHDSADVLLLPAIRRPEVGAGAKELNYR